MNTVAKQEIMRLLNKGVAPPEIVHIIVKEPSAQSIMYLYHQLIVGRQPIARGDTMLCATLSRKEKVVKVWDVQRNKNRRQS